MSIFAGRDMGFALRSLSNGNTTAPLAANYIASTTFGERVLLFITVLLLPLDNHIPPVAGLSSLFLMFATLGVYVAINRLGCFNGVWMHPIFVAAYVFIGVIILLEFASPLSSYKDIGRFALMIAGALLVASLCRDRVALQVFLYGYIGAALWLGALLILTSYETLHGAVATDFNEASEIRGEVFGHNPISGNLNVMAFVCAQGGIVAVAFALTCSRPGLRILFFAMATLCFTASFLSMSRGGAVISILSCLTILYTHGVRYGKSLILCAVLGACVFLAVPDAIWTRMVFSMEGEQGKDSRAVLYKTALGPWPEYISTGIGAGNFLEKWGFEKGFTPRAKGDKAGFVHNTFLQVTINWGLPGLFAFIAIIWQAYRCVPKRCGNDPLSLSVLGVAVSLILLLPFTHNFYDKMFSFGLGLLVCYQRWLSPQSVAQPPNE